MAIYKLKTTFILLGTAIFIYILGLFPNFVLNFYSTGIYPIISTSIRWISSLIPFAIGDILYAAVVIYLLKRIIQYFFRVKKLGWQKTDQIIIPVYIINTCLIFYISFKLLWGLNYSRPSISTQLNIGNEKYSVKQLILLGDYYVKKTNNLKNQTLKLGKQPQYGIKELKNISIQAYRNLAKKYPVLSYQNPSFKPVFSSWLISKAGISGYYNPLSGEANLNMYLPEFTRPYISCHEIAHQLGIAYEDEANLVGYLSASESPNIYFRYAANYEMLKYVLNEIGMVSPDEFKILYNQISPAILKDFKTEDEFWTSYDSKMNYYMDFTFDKLLKLNNQPKGINSYQDIVIWLWNIHKEELAVDN